jgi:23S rRNA pseudouridine1911/1915/1917 synthase
MKKNAPKVWDRAPKKPLEVTTVENLRVLYEDNHIIAVNKRNSDIVQGDKTGDAVLSDIIKQYIKNKYNKPGEVFCGTVHKQAKHFHD